MRFSKADQRQSSDRPAPDHRRQRSGDIVIRVVGADSYHISTLEGESLGTSHDRLDAMRRACVLARRSGGYVWIRIEGSSDTYREVLCP